MAAAFTIFRGRNGKYYFNLEGANGEIILASEGYSSRSSCRRGVASVRVNGVAADRFEKRKTRNGRPYFVLKAGNGRVVGTSQIYRSERTCDKGIAAVRRSVRSARLVD